MDEQRRTKISKYLSKHLRHQPERLGLELAPGGWVLVSDLLAACRRNGVAISLDDLREVVALNNKQRFAFDETGERIRANQGHSVTVDLGLESLEPPAELYHGTAEHTLAAIERDGLQKMNRHHVHLSADLATALAVGRRHGRPIVFAVAAGQMHAAGIAFYCSANGVWLVDEVPAQYLRLVEAGPRRAQAG
jgi:putative RNA 2'-phosphotransferase